MRIRKKPVEPLAGKTLEARPQFVVFADEDSLENYQQMPDNFVVIYVDALSRMPIVIGTK